MTEFHSFPKPLPGTAKIARLKRKAEGVREAKREQLKLRRERVEFLRKRRQEIYDRDRGHCRVCGKPVEFEHPNPDKAFHWHHIRYRSAGGDDSTANGICICRFDHEREHASRIEITGNGDGTVFIREFNPVSGRVASAR